MNRWIRELLWRLVEKDYLDFYKCKFYEVSSLQLVGKPKIGIRPTLTGCTILETKKFEEILALAKKNEINS